MPSWAMLGNLIMGPGWRHLRVKGCHRAVLKAPTLGPLSAIRLCWLMLLFVRESIQSASSPALNISTTVLAPSSTMLGNFIKSYSGSYLAWDKRHLAGIVSPCSDPTIARDHVREAKRLSCQYQYLEANFGLRSTTLQLGPFGTCHAAAASETKAALRMHLLTIAFSKQMEKGLNYASHPKLSKKRA